MEHFNPILGSDTPGQKFISHNSSRTFLETF